LLRRALVDAALRRYIGVKEFNAPRCGARRNKMSKHDNYRNELQADLQFMDVIEIERQARALRARAVAEAFRAARLWVSARLRRAPGGQTA
jgi:hypothetical protein